MSIFKMKFYRHILSRLYIFIITKQLTNKVQDFVGKKGKCTGLVSILIFELRLMSLENIINEKVGFEV